MTKENALIVFASLLMMICGLWLINDGFASEGEWVEGWIGIGLIVYGIIRICVMNRSARQ